MGLRYGRKPKVEDPRDFLLSKQTLPAVTEPFGHGGTYKDWKMLGNGPDPTSPEPNGVGDCVVASAEHETMIALTDALYTPAEVQEARALFNGATAVSDYSAAGGYVVGDESTDQGLEVRGFLKYRKATGLLDINGHRHKLGIYAAVDFANLDELLVAIKYFEACPIGCTVTQGNMEAFNEAEAKGTVCVWDADNTEVDGGHCIPLVGRPDKDHFAAITWGRRILITADFLAKQTEEVWCYLTAERIAKATGKNYEGASEAVLAEYLKAVQA